MFQLSEKYIEIIEQRILQSGLTNTSLQNDLLDHYCCFIEEQMNDEQDFERAYKTAYSAITPDGAQDIETELILLLTFNKQIGMKRLLYGAGFVAAFCMSIGFLCRMMHWEPANIFIAIGSAALILAVVVLLVNTVKYYRVHPVAYNVRVLSGVFAGVLLGAGSIFKVLYFPYANVLNVSGMVMLTLLFLPLFFYQLYKKAIA